MDAPPVNAVSTQFMEEIMAAFDRINDLDEVRVAILTGAGKCFSAGADIKSRARGHAEPGQAWAHGRRAREMSWSIVECKKPVIAAINGPALGAGLGLAASCDIVVCSQNASIGLPEVDVGLMGGGRHTMRLFGHSLTRRMMMTGYRVPGEELYRRGIVEACTSPEGLMPAAMDMARLIASKSPVATLRLFHGASRITLPVCPPPAEPVRPVWGALQKDVLASTNDRGGNQSWDLTRDLMTDMVRLSATKTERVRLDPQTEIATDHEYGAAVSAARPDLARMHSTTTVRIERPAGGTTLVARSVTTQHHTAVEVDISVDGQPFWHRNWLFGAGVKP